MTVLVLFFCSGATALVYEVLWSKYLSLLLGSSILAQSVVLAAFMGGLALGNRWFGARADALRQPLAWYGYLEVLIGLYAFFFDSSYHAADAVFVWGATGLLEHARGLLLVKALLGGALLLGPTILMGGTLPLVAAWLQQRHADASRWSARFYAVNSLGAVVGSAASAFYLVQHLGLIASLQATALVNVGVGFTALWLARRVPAPQPADLPEAPTAAASVADDPGTRGAVRLGCVLVAITGAVSMGLEVLASRTLVLLVGASLQAFALVLIGFILGIGLGSSVVASPRFRRVPWSMTVVGLLLAAAAWVGLFVVGLETWIDLYRELKTGLTRSPMGFRLHQLVVGLMAVAVLGVPAALIGAVLPVSIRVLGEGQQRLGRQVGRLLTWNTLGAVVGSLTTGFWLMPALGLRGAFLALVVALALAALAVAWTRGPRWTVLPAIGVIAALLAVGRWGGDTWRLLLSSGVFRMRETAVDHDFMKHQRERVRLLFYEDAADATVTVDCATNAVLGSVEMGLLVNGKPDASSRGDLSTQWLCGHLPLILKPESKRVFVLGLGSGATAGSVLRHPVDQVVVAENCEPVVRASRFFTEINGHALEDPRLQLILDDGRTVLKLSRQPFDVIISEPSNPWMAGVGSVFSREFYELCTRHLAPEGLMVQWFHIYEMTDSIVSLVLRTFAGAFPHLELWDVNGGDIVLIGSRRPWDISEALLAAGFDRPAVRAQLHRIGLKNAGMLWARQLASQDTAFAIPGPGPVQSDTFPVLEYEAPRAFFIGGYARGLSHYDERLVQHRLAPPAKRRALAALPDADLGLIFAEFTSCYADLRDHLQAHADGTVLDHAVHPCVFRPSPGAPHTQAPAHLPPAPRAVAEADLRLAAGDPDWRAPALVVLQYLNEPPPTGTAAATGTSVGRAATLAASAALQHGDPDLAGRLIDAALRREPTILDLQYLQRIHQRRVQSAPAARAP